MKVLVLGDGLLGSEIIRQTGWDYISRKKDNINAEEFDSWSDLLSDYDTIINCIAFTGTYVDDKTNSWNLNIRFVDKLVEFCNFTKKKLVQISTDYIYAGSIPNASEDDVPVHLNTWYGYTKLVGDALVQLRSDNYLVCRLSHKPNPFPYGSAWTDIHTNCDSVDVIASLVIKLVNNQSNGVFNVGTEVKSIYELVKKSDSKIKPSKKPNHVPHDISMNINKLKNKL